MPHATCAHCGATIVDHSTMVERGGESFCCHNCASAMHGQQPEEKAVVCAHCRVGITDPSTLVTRNGMTFCCPNCAAMMATGAGQRH